MVDTTPRLKLPFMSTAQVQKELTFNELAAMVDALVQMNIIDKDLSAPPASPAEGDTYIVGATATGAWAGKDGQLAYYVGGWHYLEPQAGWLVWVADESNFYSHNGTDWLPTTVTGAENLVDLLDVAVGTPVEADDGKVLAWDFSEGKFTLQLIAPPDTVPLAELPDVEMTLGAPVDGFVVYYEHASGLFKLKVLPTPEAGSSTFVGLSDTPANYTGAANKLLVVNSGGTGVVFADMPSIPTQLTDLEDFPAAYTGHGGKLLAIKVDETGVEFVPPGGGGGGIADAPSDGNLYARKDAAWEAFTPGAGGGAGSSAVAIIAGTTYDLLAADASKYLLFTAATAKTVTVRPNVTEALPADGEWHIRNRGAADLTLVAGSGVTLNIPTGGNLIVPTGGTVTLKRTASDVFDVMGVTQASSVLGDAAFKNTGTVAGTVAAGDDTRLSNNYRTSGGVQEVLNHTKTVFNSTPTSIIGIAPAGQVGDWLSLYRDGGAALINTVSNGNQAGFRAIAYGGLTNNRFIRYGGTLTAPADIATNDALGDLNFWARVGNTEAELARIRAEYFGADPSVSNNRATRLRFYVGRDGSTSTAEALRLEYQNITAYGTIAPSADNTFDIGKAGFRIREIFCANAVINTSDETLKRDIQPVTDDLLDAWAGVEWVAFRWADSYEQKGRAARWHFGMIAQHVRDVIDAHFGEGTAVRMGIICYDEWEAQSEIVSPIMAEHTIKVQKYDKDGVILIGEFEEELETYDTGEVEIVQPARPAGGRWGLRYGECQAIENAYRRREALRQAEENAFLRAEIASLKALVQ